MIKRLNKEVKIGFVVVVAFALLIWGFNFLKGKNILKNTDEYYALFDNIEGMTDNASIYLNGLKVGSVFELSVCPERQNKIIVGFDIERKYKIPKNSIVQMYSESIMGTKGIRLLFSNSSEFHHAGDTLRSDFIPSMTDMLTPIKDEIEKVIASVDTLISSINKTLDAQTQSGIQNIVSNLDNTTKSLENTMGPGGDLNITISSLKSIMENIKENNADIENIINNFSDLSDSLANSQLAAAINNANATLDELSSLLAGINKGTGTMGQLATNDSLYIAVQSLAQDLDSLIIDLQANPKKYINVSVFGGKNKD
jgi:phospholipid/cholesterol/gamma-HCH transport system substrate-binding protein